MEFCRKNANTITEHEIVGECGSRGVLPSTEERCPPRNIYRRKQATPLAFEKGIPGTVESVPYWFREF